MKSRPTDPTRLDVVAFARRGGRLDGELPPGSLARLEACLSAPADAAMAPVRWHAAGEVRAGVGGEAEVWLRLRADGVVPLQCQRCLQPLAQPLAVDRWFRFVATEDEAARLDEELDDDVLVWSRAFDLVALVEDELLLALPIVPRHEACPEPLPLPVADADDPAPAHPFAELAALRRAGPAGRDD
ncbi:MAG: DUF177 domain-containing protein [Rubrivivax sp.]|jgi:uncharacterized protein|nr:DUF177 domain-containing protein [Rubrivivax sp.]